jgi:SAM-dependent methyltransferase
MGYKIDFYRTIFRILVNSAKFSDSGNYWNERYSKGRDSGEGSYGELALFKAKVINDLVIRNGLKSVIEFGSGDGNQLKLANYPQYTGVDVSRVAVDRAKLNFSAERTKKFLTTEEYAGERAELALSLDVIYHLVEDSVFEVYMDRLFSAAKRFVVVYSSNCTGLMTDSPHVRHREFTKWVAQRFPSVPAPEVLVNPFPIGLRSHETSFAHFFIYNVDSI